MTRELADSVVKDLAHANWICAPSDGGRWVALRAKSVATHAGDFLEWGVEASCRALGRADLEAITGLARRHDVAVEVKEEEGLVTFG